MTFSMYRQTSSRSSMTQTISSPMGNKEEIFAVLSLPKQWISSLAIIRLWKYLSWGSRNRAMICAYNLTPKVMMWSWKNCDKSWRNSLAPGRSFVWYQGPGLCIWKWKTSFRFEGTSSLVVWIKVWSRSTISTNFFLSKSSFTSLLATPWAISDDT